MPLGATEKPDVLADEDLVSEQEFWATVAACVTGYQASVPQLAEKFERESLFVDEFALSCLNRLQLRNNQQMLDLADQSGGLIYAGKLANPMAGHLT